MKKINIIILMEKNNPRTVCAKLLRNERNGERIYEISYTAKTISPQVC